MYLGKHYVVMRHPTLEEAINRAIVRPLIFFPIFTRSRSTKDWGDTIVYEKRTFGLRRGKKSTGTWRAFPLFRRRRDLRCHISHRLPVSIFH